VGTPVGDALRRVQLPSGDGTQSVQTCVPTQERGNEKAYFFICVIRVIRG
jgi:hypothetical protein